jgi:hypothetical protein
MRECPRCSELCPLSASVCECGQALQPPASTQHASPLAPIPACSCGGNGICIVCNLASYEPVGR